MANFVGMSSPPLVNPPSHVLPPRSISPITQLKHKNHWASRRLLLLQVKCSEEKTGDKEVEPQTPSLSLSSSSASNSTCVDISTYKWCAGLGGIGFLETTYLTYLKLTDSDAFCPIGVGGSCGDILNSDYAVVFGVPLPLIGMVAYGLVATFGLQLAGKNWPFGIDEANGRLVLLWASTSMAAASAYFLFILSAKFAGVLCSYCLLSALLSFSLFFVTLKEFGSVETRKMWGLQLAAASLVVASLTASYSGSQPVSQSLAEIDLPFVTTEITTESTPFTLALARHLHTIGAKMYGAFWCSHCIEQKQMFGHEAAEVLDYVECFPDGYRKGIKIEKACANVGIEGFPTWVINGQVLSGEQELSELAQASGFRSE